MVKLQFEPQLCRHATYAFTQMLHTYQLEPT